MEQLIFYPYNPHYRILLEYLYDKYPENITQLDYLNQCNIPQYRYRFRDMDTPTIQTVLPHICDFRFNETFDESSIEFHCQLEVLVDNKIIRTYCHSQIRTRRCRRSCFETTNTYRSNKRGVTSIDEQAKDYISDKHESQKKSTRDTIRIYYYQKDYWTLLSKSPKRPIETLYLKQGKKDELLEKVDTFFNKDTRDLYLSYGMPYKQIIMLYGVPGSGKTSTITAVASHFDCDIYTIPITKELTDYGLIDAFSYMNDKTDDRKRIVVLEDIDCIFDTTRKKGMNII